MRIGAVVLCGVLSSSLFATEAPERIPVFARTAQAAGGFTDPSKDREDSAKDLMKDLAKSQSLRAAASEKDALIVLEVLGRETRSEMNLMGRQNKSSLTVRVLAGEFSAELTGESDSKGVLKGYGNAAGKVVKQLEKWAATNRERLMALKPAPGWVEPTPTPKP
jgi:hypothetical protein